jgi:sugar fermentation stimulation protein A
MIFETPLIPGILLRRYARFLADICLDSGETITAHCPNSGSMKGVNVPGSPVLVSYHPSPKRRLQYTWEMIFLDGGWVGINTLLPNKLVAEALSEGLILSLRKYKSFRTEANISSDTRLDFVLGQREQCWLEVKNVTLVENGIAKFPDSVTTRGAKHLQHLTAHVKQGNPSVMLFVVQHHGGNIFTPADEIDTEYGKLLRKAAKAGVKILVWKAKVTPQAIHLVKSLPYKL